MHFIAPGIFFFLVVVIALRHPLLSPGVALLLTSLGILLIEERESESKQSLWAF